MPVDVKVQFIRAGVPTANGRIYSEDVLRKAIEQAPRELLAYEHTQPTLDQVVGVVRELRIDRNGYFVGTVTLADNHKGRVLQEINRLGGNIPFRPSGVGSLRVVNGVTMVADDYRLQGFSLDSECIVKAAANYLRRVGREKVGKFLRTAGVALGRCG